ncbi:MAG: TPM domain-containing protein [Lachnospiraceae bacterium]|nr:TPM domain-containing protein [Lachnospiraceae bacterium]
MMRRKDRVFFFCVLCLLTALLILPLTVRSEAGEQRVFDEAGLLSSDQTQSLETRIQELRTEMNMDLVLVTTEDTGGYSSEEYADAYYENGSFGSGSDHSGALLLIDMDNRQLYVSTEGAMIRFLTDDRIDTMMDQAIPYMQQLDYSGAAGSMIGEVQAFYQKGIPNGQYNYDRETGKISRYRSIRWYEVLLAFAVSAFCGAGACLNVRKEYAMKREQRQAANYLMAYRSAAQFHYHNQNDVLAGSSVIQNLIAQAVNRGAGGGFGNSSGPRSTTHTSGGGHTHGGGGRGF